jgi:hypothetical protein
MMLEGLEYIDILTFKIIIPGDLNKIYMEISTISSGENERMSKYCNKTSVITV